MKPLKILHIANRAEKHLGKKFYSLPFKINNGFVRNGHNVYWFSDRDVAKTASLIPSAKFGRAACNRRLLEVCRNFRPDVIALAHADLITVETLREVRALLPEARVFQYNIDGLATAGNIGKILDKIEVVDATFITTGGPALKQISAPNAPACFIPNPVDPSIDCLCNWQFNDFDYDLFFVYSRSEWIDQTSMRALAFQNLPHDPPGMRVLMSTNLWGSEFIRGLGTAKMGTCFNQKPPGEPSGLGSNLYLYSSDRISQLMGNGLLTFSDSSFSLTDLYGTDALVDVSDYDDFRDKARFYQANDAARVSVARQGHELSHREFNERLVTGYMLETVMGEEYSHPYRWPLERY